MAIDFTGVTNVFMGGDVNNKTTSLQGVYAGETELWSYTDQGYVWRMMGGTYNGYDSFSVGDVVCFGSQTSTIWTNMSKTRTYDCRVPENYLSRVFTTNYVSAIKTIKMGWSDAIGDDGKVIGWHLPSDAWLSENKTMCDHAYCVAETAQNGVYARFQTNSAYYISTYNALSYNIMLLQAGTGRWWCTVGDYNNPFGYYSCKIKEYNTNTYIYGHKTVIGSTVAWAYTTNTSELSGRYNVVFKRVKIAQ